VPLGSAVKAASTNPAKALGLYDRFGSIEPGKTANLLLLDESLEVKSIFLRGKRI
ncbi:MAG: amidohydrolase family protein, partial [Eubacteriales bacterium]|nr:amidohydrolase family protein [Eubacteriales bacterium]